MVHIYGKTFWYVFVLAAVTAGVNACRGKQTEASVSVQEKKDSPAIKLPAPADYAAIDSAKQLIQDGDLITRSDNDFESLTLQNFSNTDRSYSHSGIAFHEGSELVVYHSMTGAENPSGSCRRDPADSFVNPLQKTGFGIFRYPLSAAEKEKFHRILKDNHARKIPFDITFNLHSDDS